jgi:hypothetical protein
MPAEFAQASRSIQPRTFSAAQPRLNRFVPPYRLDSTTKTKLYGWARATETGRVDVTWAVADGNQVRLLWKESGGPAMKPPNQKGFGLQLIETLCPFELHGTAEVRFVPDGLECELTFPIA